MGYGLWAIGYWLSEGRITKPIEQSKTVAISGARLEEVTARLGL